MPIVGPAPPEAKRGLNGPEERLNVGPLRLNTRDAGVSERPMRRVRLSTTIRSHHHGSPIKEKLMRITRWRRGIAAGTAIACGALGGIALTAPTAVAAAGKTWYVSASASSDPACSAATQSNPSQTLAAAVACARSGDTIRIGAGRFPAGVTLTRSVKLVGSGAGTVLAAGASFTPLISDAPGTSVTLSALTLDASGPESGVHASSGTLRLIGVTVENSVAAAGSAVDVEPAGGSAAVTVSDSTFTGDLSDGGAAAAGGLYVSSASGQPASTLTVTDSTFEGDLGPVADGLVVGNATATVLNSTFDSSASSVVGGIGSTGGSATLRLGNDLIDAANATYTCNSEGTVDDLGHNLLSVPGGGSCGAIVNGTNGDQVGTAAQPIDPRLGPLQDNGGQTETEALLPGSPALGAGDAGICQAAPVGGRDQRGRSRNDTARLACDVGAYDSAGKGHVWYVSAKATGTPTCSAASQADPFKTIAAALGCAQSGDTVKIAAGTYGGLFSVNDNVVLAGAGANRTTIADTTSGGEEVTTAPGTFVTLDGLTVDGAAANGDVDSQGASLILDRVAVTRSGGIAGSLGAVFADPSAGAAALTVFDSTVSGSAGTEAGGVFVTTSNGGGPPSELTLVNSTISGNQGPVAGAIRTFDTTATLRDDTISGNQGDCGFVNGADGDQVGTSSSPLNPGLGALAANGGPTQTMALQPGSPAIGAGGKTDCEAWPVNDLDQRGSSRRAATRGACDVGAYDTGGA